MATFDPNWLFTLESAECHYRSTTQFIFPGSTLFLSPNYPLWSIGNALLVNTEDPATQATDFAAVAGTVEEAIAKLKQHSMKPRVLITMAHDSPASRAVSEFWHRVLTERGFEADTDDGGVCMAVTEAQMIPVRKYDAVRKEEGGVRCVRATMEDLAGAIEAEPGSPASLGWRTEKCVEVLSRSESVSAVYLCYCNGVAVAKMSVVIVAQPDGTPAVGFISRVNTDAEYRRRGLASRVLEFGLRDLFARKLVGPVVLFANEEGPIRLYKSLGFECVKQFTEVEYVLAE
ncbi:hypothetical protein HDU98_006276 [Podochytrium sp. JEL0797]|nr:hypothetical protein HDU98_006276 [Podochytrium sp. JEL0797]